MSSPPTKSQARHRILETADRLFYTEGIHAVGIDRIIAEAGVAKMTLYNHFPSKDDLILAVLQHRETKIFDFLDSAILRHAKRGKTKLEALFAGFRDWFRTPEFRGCAFINTAIELTSPSHPAFQFVKQHKRRVRDKIRQCLQESVGRADPKEVETVMIMIEGAIVTSVIEGNPKPIDVVRDTAFRLLRMEQRPS